MKRGRFLRFSTLCLSVLPVMLAFSPYGQQAESPLASKAVDPKKDPAPLLLDIYNEVKELGFYENEDFLRREFQMNLDGNDNNKEEYVMVFSQTIDGVEKMSVQVTYFKPEKDNWIIKHAVETKEIKCSLKGDDVKIGSCDYKDKEIRNVLAEILEGIRLEKELLKLIRKDGL